MLYLKSFMVAMATPAESGQMTNPKRARLYIPNLQGHLLTPPGNIPAAVLFGHLWETKTSHKYSNSLHVLAPSEFADMLYTYHEPGDNENRFVHIKPNLAGKPRTLCLKELQALYRLWYFNLGGYTGGAEEKVRLRNGTHSTATEVWNIFLELRYIRQCGADTLQALNNAVWDHRGLNTDGGIKCPPLPEPLFYTISTNGFITIKTIMLLLNFLFQIRPTPQLDIAPPWITTLW